MHYQLHLGDCIQTMRAMPDASVDSIVTDPPYELGFMSKGWDSTGIANSVEMWREALRVLKPGGHLLAFSGTRTYHRMVCAIEDAGFEVRDQIGWLYGSGFPKSLDVSKAIDKAAGAEREVVGFDAEKAKQQTRAVGTTAFGDYAGNTGVITAPATDAARQWQGWGTALKPAWEPICVARKPLVGNVAANVLAHGTGALNIDGCRVAHDEDCRMMAPSQANIDNPSEKHRQAGRRTAVLELKPEGRWPANIIHDGSDEVVGAFPGDEARFFYCAKASKRDRDEGLEGFELGNNMRVNGPRESEEAKHATLRANTHPTVKPTDLMRYLCRLVTPPGGLVLDPFMGSGSTGKAAMLEGFRFIGCELSVEYMEIARARIIDALVGDIA